MGIELKVGINPEKYGSRERRTVSDSLKIIHTRPEISREVQMMVVGLPFNAPDSLVHEQVELFDGKVKGNPVQGTYKVGPWRGQYNGDRRYTVDFSGQILPMGTYHILGGARCRIAYPGNVQTCARCHNFPKACPGSGMARSCDEKGGKRRSLSDHMKRVWVKLSDLNLDNSFNVIEHQFVTRSVKDSKSNMITANGKPHGAEIIRDLESETPDKKGNISETVVTTKGTSSGVVNTVGYETLQGHSPSPSETGDDGENPSTTK